MLKTLINKNKIKLSTFSLSNWWLFLVEFVGLSRKSASQGFSSFGWQVKLA